MSSTSSPDTDDTFAAGYAVLARCWRDPDDTLVDALAAGALDAVVPDVDPVSLHPLRAEYTRLFVGPGEPLAPPYESLYRDEGGQLLGPTASAVVAWYRTYDVGLHPEVRDLPDHVAAELEFLAHLHRRGETDAAEQFVAEHLGQWVGTFLDAVRASAREPFYAALADATERALLD